MDLVKNNDATYTTNPIGIANQMDTLIKYNTIANITPQITNFISDFNNEISGLYFVFEILINIKAKTNISQKTVVNAAPL